MTYTPVFTIYKDWITNLLMSTISILFTFFDAIPSRHFRLPSWRLNTFLPYLFPFTLLVQINTRLGADSNKSNIIRRITVQTLLPILAVLVLITSHLRQVSRDITGKTRIMTRSAHGLTWFQMLLTDVSMFQLTAVHLKFSISLSIGQLLDVTESKTVTLVRGTITNMYIFCHITHF